MPRGTMLKGSHLQIDKKVKQDSISVLFMRNALDTHDKQKKICLYILPNLVAIFSVTNSADRHVIMQLDAEQRRVPKLSMNNTSFITSIMMPQFTR